MPDARVDRVVEERVVGVFRVEARHHVVAAAGHAGVIRPARAFREQHDVGAGVVRGDRSAHSRRAAARDEDVGLLDDQVGCCRHVGVPLQRFSWTLPLSAASTHESP
jgi:hypothetical protein